MTITLTIDTHPHTNALIPDQVRSIVEAALQKAKLGTVISINLSSPETSSQKPLS